MSKHDLPKRTVIYVMSHPDDPRSIYIGRTMGNLLQRFHAHLRRAQRRHTLLDHWIMRLREQGLVPTIRIICEITLMPGYECLADFDERLYISIYDDDDDYDVLNQRK